MVPARDHAGVRIMSMDMLLDEGAPLRWREPEEGRFAWRSALEGILNLTDLRAYLGHVEGSKSLIVCFGIGSFRPKHEKFCVKLTLPVAAFVLENMIQIICRSA